ncbi:sugar ABC transporter substrate-binding protein [bacterium]|nr:sugar ABC transporter substrate-binding protein [bacterium]
MKHPGQKRSSLFRQGCRLAAFIVPLALAACSDRGLTEDAKADLVLAINSNARDRPSFEAAGRQFEATHPENDVELRIISGRYYQKCLVMIAGKVAPDLMWMGQSFSEFADRGAFLDITDRFERDVDVAEFFPQCLEWYRVDGRQMGVPYVIDIDFIVYNKDLFDQAGVPYPDPDWEFDDFLGTAKALTTDRDGDGRIDQYGYYGGLGNYLFGAEFIAKDGLTPQCDTPEMLDYIRTNLDLHYKYNIAPKPEPYSTDKLDIYTPFVQGRYAMQKMFTGNLPHMSEKFADLNWDIALHPKVRRRAHWASSGAIVMSADTKRADEAWELNKAFFSDEFMETMAYRGLPPKPAVARKVFADHTGKPESLGLMIRAADYLYPTPRVPHLQELQQIWAAAVARAMSGRATPEQAMEQAQKDMELAIRNFTRNE